MLTGDKVETACCIAISAGFKNRRQHMVIMKEIKSENQMMVELKDFESRCRNSLLVIDGESLNNCVFKKGLEEKFFKIATQAPSVCVCRCSPQDKAYIVQCIQKYTKKRTCAVGDGGNDVSMILEANVGIGIVGKEGNQASLAADYSINQFSYI